MRVLILEENLSEVKLIESILKDSGSEFESKQAKTESEFIKFINRFKPDIIISGTSLSKFSVNEALKYLHEQELLIPVVLVTGNLTEEQARDYLKKGVDDYLTKFNLLLLPAVIIKAIELKQIQREKKSAEKQVKDNEARLRSFYTNNPEAILEVGFGCEILNMNQSAIELLEVGPRNKKSKFTDYLHTDDSKPFREAHAQVCRGNKRNLSLRLKNGKDEIWIDCSLIPILNEERNVASVLLIGINITEKVQMQKALSRSQTDFNALISAIDDSIWTVDKELRLDIFNETADRLYYIICGRNLRKGMTLRAFAGSIERENFWTEKYNKVFKGEKISFIDEMLIEGESRYFSLTVYPIYFEGEIKGATIVSHEITGFILADRKLRQSENEFRTLSEAAPVGIFKSDSSGNCLYANQILLNMFGVSQDEISGKKWYSFIQTKELEAIEKVWKNSVADRKDFNMNVKWMLPDGENKWMDIKAVIADSGASEDDILYFGTINDVTSLKEANIKMQEKQLLLNAVESSSNFGFFIREADGDKDATWSNSNFEIFEKDPSEGPFSISSIVKMIHPADLDRFNEAFKNLEKGETLDFEFRITTPRNHLKYLHSIAHPVKDESGKIVRYVGTTHDMTAQRISEQANKSQLELLKNAFEIAKIGTWDYNLQTGRLIWSKELKRIMGMKEDENSPSLEVFLAMVHPTDRKELESMIAEQMQKGEPATLEYSIYTHGEIKSIFSVSYANKNEQQEIISLNGICMDVSKMRRTENKLKATEDLFNSFFENVPDAVMIESEEGIILNANKNACQLKGVQRSDIVGKNFLDLIPSQHHPEMMKNFKKFFSGESNDFITKTWNITGDEIPVHIKATRILYKDQPAVLLNIRNQEKE